MKVKKLLIAGMLSVCMSSGAQDAWKGTWATAVEYTGKGDMPKASLTDRSCRQVLHMSLGGSELRLKLSNEFGSSSVEIKSVYIADTQVGDLTAIDRKTARYLKFGGKKNVKIEAGKAAYSDVSKYRLKADQLLTVTIDYGETPEHATSHRGSRTTSYIMAQVGGKPASAAKAVFGKEENVDHWYNLSSIEVKAKADVPVVAILGNSITDGRGSTTNEQNRWTDFLSTTLNQEKPYGVLNLGIGGNCVVEGGLSHAAFRP